MSFRAARRLSLYIESTVQRPPFVIMDLLCLKRIKDRERERKRERGERGYLRFKRKQEKKQREKIKDNE